MGTGAWLIGSVASMVAQSLSVTANASAQGLQVAAGSYYLHDWLSTRSLLNAVATAIQSHTQITTATVILSRDRKVRITTDIASAITWTDTTLRDLLGFQGNLASSTTHVADFPSPLIWVPDRPENPSARAGRHGTTVYDTVVSSSGGSGAHIVATQHDERIFNDFDFRYVLRNYYDTGPNTNTNGQWVTFFDRVVRRFLRFKVYRQTLFDPDSDANVGLLASNALGPYRFRPSSSPIQHRNDREIEHVERLYRVPLSVVMTTEY